MNASSFVLSGLQRGRVIQISFLDDSCFIIITMGLLVSVWGDFEASMRNKSITEVPGCLSLFKDHWRAARMDGLFWI